MVIATFAATTVLGIVAQQTLNSIHNAHNAEVKFIGFLLLGPVTALFTHMFWVGYLFGVALTLPWFIGAAVNKSTWLFFVGLTCWILVGALFAYTLVPLQ